MRIVVAGGGYAGLACLLELRKLAPRAELHLLDPGAVHLKQTLLHEAVRRPLADLQVPYATLAARYRFEHHRVALGRDGSFAAKDLQRWSAEGALRAGRRRLEYDWLVIATGAQPRLRGGGGGGGGRVYDQHDLRECEPRALVKERLLDGEPGPVATIVGGGASGVQIAFELAETLRVRAPRARVRLLDTGERLLAALPAAAHEYVRERMAAAAIEYLPRCAFIGQSGAALRLRDAEGAERTIESSLTLLFGGVDAHPCALEANRYGQVVVNGEALGRVFAAGDCVHYAARGLNAPTAQAAVRKGKHVAANITRLRRRRIPVAYGFQELGYVVSLGSLDAVGWLLVRENLVRGLAATAIKRVVEAQYDLFVEGLDTYVV